MNTLYLILDFGVIIFPLLLSFDKKVNFVRLWKAVFGAIVLIGIPFLTHDYCFTAMGIWGFNSTYLTGIHITNLPIEEVLFFIVVPFACTFIYQCCIAYFSRFNYERFNIMIYSILVAYGLIVLLMGIGRWYSTMVAIVALGLLAFLIVKRKDYPLLPLAFFLSLIPFFGMNSILTGAMTLEPIVWYDNTENIAFRWGTIPAEDILYSLILVAGNILVFDWLKTRKISSNNFDEKK